MKLNVKTVTGKNFTVDVAEEATVSARPSRPACAHSQPDAPRSISPRALSHTAQVADVKQAIAASQGFEVSLQKLIFSGKIMEDAKSLTEYGVAENHFLVCMVSKVRVIALVHRLATAWLPLAPCTDVAALCGRASQLLPRPRPRPPLPQPQPPPHQHLLRHPRQPPPPLPPQHPPAPLPPLRPQRRRPAARWMPR